MIFIFIISLLGMNTGAAYAAGTTYYVDNTVTCSNSGSGTMATPFCTLAKAALVATPGDTVRVLHGTYAETIYPPSGTAALPVTFKGDPGVTITGNAAGFGSAFAISSKSYVVIDGFTIVQTKYMGIYVTSSHHITLKNNDISYAGDPAILDSHRRGIYFSETTDSTITGNRTHHNTCVGIMLMHSDNNVISNNLSYANFSLVRADAAGIALIGSSYNDIVNNITYGNEDSGISLYDDEAGIGSSYNIIAQNLIYGNGDHGIDNNDAPYNTMVDNTVHGNGTVGINLEGSVTGSHHGILANNIISANGTTPPSGAYGGNLRVDAMSVDGTAVDYDVFNRQDAAVQVIWSGTYYTSLTAFRSDEPAQEVHGKQANPLFVAPVAPVLRTNERPYSITASVGDYHLAAGSPAIDSANSGAPSHSDVDLEGNPRVDHLASTNTGTGVRAYDDRGVYEYQPTGTAATTVTVACGGGIPAVTFGSSLTCVATVIDGTGLNTPSGQVYWTTNDSGIFAASPCNLGGSAGTGTCSISYRPGEVGSGSHVIKANYEGDVNFLASSGNQTVTVNTKAVVPGITAENKVYDGTTAATLLTRTLTGVLTGEVVSLEVATATFNTKDVGADKPVTGSGLSLTGRHAANYHLSPTTAATTADITPFAITVTADAKAKYVGTVDPALTYTVSPALFSGDAFTGALTRESGEAVGEYDILQGTLSAGSNYSMTFVGALLTVTSVPPANLDISVDGNFQENYQVASNTSTRDSYVGLDAGPVELASKNNIPVLAAERVIYKVNGVNTSFSEMMGLPHSQLDTTYWLPWYNNVDLDTQLRFANVSNAPATVHVFIGGQEMGTGFTLAAGESTRQSFTGINNGPVKIVSTQNIVAAERVIYKVNGVNTSFSEMMALPDSQLDTTFWFPWYNNVNLDTQLRFANVSNAPATVHVFIGEDEVTPLSGITLAVGESTRVSYAGVDNGPVKIVSNQNIVAAERVIYKVNGVNTSFSEMMGLPHSQLDTTYWLPWYNNVDLDTQLRFANVSNAPATVHVFIGGQEMGTGFTLAAGESTRQSFVNANNGPVKIVSTVPIVVAERVIYKVKNVYTSFSEMMALPNGQLDIRYWLPWYNNINLDTQLRFGAP